MVEQRVHLPTIDMFQPTPGGRYSPTEMALFRNFFGETGLELCEQFRKGITEIPQEKMSEVQQSFYAGIERTYELQGIDPRRFYREHYRSVGVILQNLQSELLPAFGTGPELKDEAVWPDNPARVLRRLASSGTIDPQLSYEIKRSLLLTHISCMQDAHLRNNGISIDSEMNDVLEVFNDHLYQGEEGEGKPRAVYALHDNETNNVLEVTESPGDFLGCTGSIHLKRHPKVMRFIPEIGYVLTKSRVKEKKGSVLKPIAKAARNGGIIKPITDVQDYFGMKFAIEDPTVDPQRLEEKVIEALKKHPYREISQVIEDHSVDNDRGQSSEVEFRRLQVYMDDDLPPLELMFYTMRDFLNTEFDTGKKDEVTGVYSGSAHKLYELRRMRDVMPVIFPRELYRINTDKLLIDQMESVAEKLKALHTIS